MRVVRIQGAERLELDEAPEPQVRRPTDAIVEVSQARRSAAPTSSPTTA